MDLAIDHVRPLRMRSIFALALLGTAIAVCAVFIRQPLLRAGILVGTAVLVAPRRWPALLGWAAGVLIAVSVPAMFHELFVLYAIAPLAGGAIAGGLTRWRQGALRGALIGALACVAGGLVGVLATMLAGQWLGTYAGMTGGIVGVGLGGAIGGSVAGATGSRAFTPS